MESIAIKTYCRIKNKLPYIWDGRPTGGARVGHLRYWEEKIKNYNIAVNEIDNDQLVKSRTWTRNFEVLDFETTRDDTHTLGYIVRFGQCSVFLIPINKRRRWKLVLSLTDGALYCS
jgi:hypothetical protein